MKKNLNSRIFACTCAVCFLLGSQNVSKADENDFAAEIPGASYTLTQVTEKGPNTIAKFELVDNKLVPVYYRLDLKQTEYGTDGTEKYYHWSFNDKNQNVFTEVSDKTNADITFKYDGISKTPLNNTSDLSSSVIEGNFVDITSSGALGNSGSIGEINANFVGNSFSRTNSDTFGSTISNSGTIGQINGNFIGNHTTTEIGYAKGGNIVNNGTIGAIKGDFVGNYAKTNGAMAYGGAIRNLSNGYIGNIKGSFIGNYASGGTDSFGGAIYNDNGKFGDLTGDFIGNYSSASDGCARGGAIASYGGEIKSLTGDFIGNYASSPTNGLGGAMHLMGTKIGSINGSFINNYAKDELGSTSQGGAINAVGAAEIGSITGDFVGNYVESQSGLAKGGAIFNGATIKDIKGDFVGNYATGLGGYGGAIYNTEAVIESITGNFIGNYTYGNFNGDERDFSEGGAIYNYKGTIGNINGSFIGNHSSNDGGAIYSFEGNIGDITGDFIGNYVSSKNTGNSGGAILASYGSIGNVIGNFIGNYAASSSSFSMFGAFSYGGAIHNNANIESLTGDFAENYASANSVTDDLYSNVSSAGGAIFNSKTIGNITGDFVGNYTKSVHESVYDNPNPGEDDPMPPFPDEPERQYSVSSTSQGGAIYNEGGSIDGDLKGNFIANNAISETSSKTVGADAHSQGGAIYSTGNINSITGDFTNNSVQANASSESSFARTGSSGGAIYNGGTIGNIKGNFIGNNVSASSSGFDKDNSRSDASGGAIYNSGTIGGITNSNFVNNYAKAEGENVFAQGGAIYTEKNLNIIADNGSSLFSGNYTDSNGTIDQNAIFVSTNLQLNTDTGKYEVYDNEAGTMVEYSSDKATTLKLDAKNNGVIQFDDNISGGAYYWDRETNEKVYLEDSKFAYNLVLSGDSSGEIILNNEVKNANISIDNTNVYVTEASYLSQNPSLAINSGVLTINHLGLGNINYQEFTLNGNLIINSVDADLQKETMGTISADKYNSLTGTVEIKNINLLNDSNKNTTSINFAPKDFSSQVSYTGANPIAYSPIYKYDVSYNPDDGFFTFVKGTSGGSGDYNPSVLPSSVAAQAGAYTTQVQTMNYAFQHADTFMNIPYIERLSMKSSGKYSLGTSDGADVGVFSPLMTKEELGGWWVKPYASFENVPLKNGPKVSNINYGTLIGYDTDLKSIANGFDRVLTGYIGYNGSSQRYQGVDSYQNGGILGGTVTLYKGNFFNATTLSAGASAGSNTTMYGHEDFALILAGLANKTGYNFEFLQGKVILQPSFLISYTFVNTFDYTNAAGLRINSDPLNAIQLAPGVKLIGNTKSGWQPYIGVSMVWNLLDESKVKADDVRLPEMSIKPYVQYGIGVQKRIKDKFTAYAQAMIHNGGRNGVSLSAGLKWTVGKK